MCKRLLLVSKMCRNIGSSRVLFCDRKSWSWFVCSVRYLASATVGSGDWSDLLFPRNNIAFNDCSQLFLVTPPLRFSRCLFGLVATSFLLFQRDLTCGFLIICLMFDMRRVDDRDHVFRDPIWGVSSSNCIYILLLFCWVQGQTVIIYPMIWTFCFGGMVVLTSLFLNSGRSA